MNRIDKTFFCLRQNDEKALITFITAGDPDLDTTARLILEMENQGADIVEIGVPFSDPIAEGPAIQEANIRALANGTTLKKIFNAICSLREKTQIPLVFFIYYNSMLHYGLDKFFSDCANAGVDGVIIPDLPHEESGEISEYTKKYGVYQIFMVASTSTQERMEAICRNAAGFLYCMPPSDAADMTDEFENNLNEMFSKMNMISDIPKCIYSDSVRTEYIHKLKKYSDGLIVGSAITETAAVGTVDEKTGKAGALTRKLKNAF